MTQNDYVMFYLLFVSSHATLQKCDLVRSFDLEYRRPYQITYDSSQRNQKSRFFWSLLPYEQ